MVSMSPTQRCHTKYALVMDPPPRRPCLPCNEAKPSVIYRHTLALKDSPACAGRTRFLSTTSEATSSFWFGPSHFHLDCLSWNNERVSLPLPTDSFAAPRASPIVGRDKMATAGSNDDSENEFSLNSVRKALIRQEDTIIFSLIERAKFPVNSPTYDKSYAPCFDSLVEFIVKNTESIQAKAGRYKSPEENPFFPEYLPSSAAPDYPFPQILHPAAASININKSIWKMYFDELLPKFVASGDDGNYAQTAACDFSLLQAISRRIHYGKFVAEVKFREFPQKYEPLIRAQDREALMNLLTFQKVEEMVKKRVEKKARVFGQEVGPDHDDNQGKCEVDDNQGKSEVDDNQGNCKVDDNQGKYKDDDNQGKYKVDPSEVFLLYDKWVMPLTKLVEVEYLLRRLD